MVDEPPLVCHGLRSMVMSRSDPIDVRVVGPQDSPSHPVDITLYDPTRHTTGRSRLHRLLGNPACGLIVVYSLAPPPRVLADLLARGCAGFVDKSAPAAELVDVLMSLVQEQRGWAFRSSAGQCWAGTEYGLSRRESEILGMITLGFTNAEISSRAFLSINTVKSYIRSAYGKLGITRRSQAVRWGMEHGMGRPEPFKVSTTHARGPG